MHGNSCYNLHAYVIIAQEPAFPGKKTLLKRLQLIYMVTLIKLAIHKVAIRHTILLFNNSIDIIDVVY